MVKRPSEKRDFLLNKAGLKKPDDKKWRRTQDSNLRDPLTGPNGFQDRRHQPLGQSSATMAMLTYFWTESYAGNLRPPLGRRR